MSSVGNFLRALAGLWYTPKHDERALVWTRTADQTMSGVELHPKEWEKSSAPAGAPAGCHERRSAATGPAAREYHIQEIELVSSQRVSGWHRSQDLGPPKGTGVNCGAMRESESSGRSGQSVRTKRLIDSAGPVSYCGAGAIHNRT